MHTPTTVTDRSRFASFAGDLRIASRQLRHAPAFSIGVILLLALGLGLGSSVFALLNGVFWRMPSGIAAPAAIRRIWTVDEGGRGASAQSIASTDFDYPRAAAIAHTFASARSGFYLADPDASILVNGHSAPGRVTYASASLFPLLGARTRLGRWYTASEDHFGNAAPVVVVSSAFWRRVLGASPDVIGSTLHVGTRHYTIIGVADPAFAGPDLEPVAAWIPLGEYPAPLIGDVPWWESRNYSGVQLLVRPTASALTSLDEARATLALRGLARTSSSADTNTRVVFGSIIEAQGPGRLDRASAIALRLGAVALVLLLTVLVNVTGLMLARATRRQHEFATRLALGISRRRLHQLLFAEAILLAVIAAGCAVMISAVGGRFLRIWLFPQTEWSTAPIDWHVLAFVAAATLVFTVAATMMTLRRVAGTAIVSMRDTCARNSSGRTSAGDRAIVVGQLALSTVLVTGALLFVASLRQIARINVGVDTDHLIYATIRQNGLGDSGAKAAATELRAVVQTFGARLGSRDVSWTSRIPLEIGGFGIPWYANGDSMVPGHAFRPTVTRVAPDYFATTGMRLLRGSGFGTLRNAVIVNRTMADSVWRGADPVGACIRLGTSDAPCHVVAGVVPDAIRSSLIESPQPQYFVSTTDSAFTLAPGADIAVLRVPTASVPSARAALTARLTEVFPDAVIRVVPLDVALERQTHPWRLGAMLFTIFGVLAVIVAATGVFSTMAFEVTRRRRDFGIRAALGAEPGRLVAGVIRRGVSPAIWGAAIGVLVAVAAGGSLRALLYHVAPDDPAILGGAVLITLVAAAVATLLPAWRAARSDPAAAMRVE